MKEKITVRGAKGTIRLKKSKNLIGLKTKDESFIPTQEKVKKQFSKYLGGFEIVEMDSEGESLDQELDSIREKDEVETGTHVYYSDKSNKPVVPTGEIYIIFHEGTNAEEQLVVLDEYRLELVERRGADRLIAKVTKNSRNPLKVAASMEQFPLVRSATPDLDIPMDEYEFFAPEDDLFSHEWHLENPGFVIDFPMRLKQGADAKVVDAWKRLGGFGSKDVTIAVIDNGFDLSHPDFEDKIVKPYNVWDSTNFIPQGNPKRTHGTPCASVALATSNGKGIVGVAPNARFMPMHGTSFTLRDTENMFDYCIDNGADIISCSWGSTDPEWDLDGPKKDAIAKAAREGRNGKGCVILFATGNDYLDYVNFYAAHPDVIAVAASTSKDEHASYSNAGLEVTVCAPSNGHWPITAARAWWDEGTQGREGHKKYWADGINRSNHHKHFGGTSSATPLVAGICALMLSVNPDLTAKQVKEILIRTADKIGSPSDYDSNGHSRKFGYGRVNADRAVAESLRMRDGGDTSTTTPGGGVNDQIKQGQGIFRFNVKKQEAKGFGVQVGVFAKYGNVLIQAERLQSLFDQPIIVSINELEGRTVYKLVVGAFDDVLDARQLSQRMKAQGVNGFIRNLKDLKL